MYYPNPTKIIMIVHPNNIEVGGQFGGSHGFRVFTGASYIVVYIRDDESKVGCLKINGEIVGSPKQQRNILRKVTL